jgi:NAD(P)-dependent dehydrogenase (short-subunit alcohol dehydrogenase family)
MLRDNVVLVVGAHSDLWRDVAVAAALHGAKVILGPTDAHDPTCEADAEAARVLREIRAAGGEAFDFAQSNAGVAVGQCVVQFALDAFGQLDGVVNIVSDARRACTHRQAQAARTNPFASNLDARFEVCRAAASTFARQRSGSVVHVTCAEGLVDASGEETHDAAQMAILGLSRAMAMRLRPFGARSNCVAVSDSPGGATAEAAALAVYLASSASESVNGQCFAVGKDEIALISQPRRVFSICRKSEWTVATIASQAVPGLSPSFFDITPPGTEYLARSAQPRPANWGKRS